MQFVGELYRDEMLNSYTLSNVNVEHREGHSQSRSTE